MRSREGQPAEGVKDGQLRPPALMWWWDGRIPATGGGVAV